MRINGVNNIGNVYKTKKASKAYGTSAPTGGKDQVQFSSFAKELSVAKQAVNNTPEVRMEKVNDIKAQIQAGQYNISASQVADKLLKQSIE